MPIIEKSGLPARSFQGAKEKKKQLSQYRRLRKEIQGDKLRLASLSDRLLRGGYAACGLRDETLPLLGNYRARIEENLHRCMQLAADLQAYINQIDDSETRRMFTLHYIEGYSWQKVAFAMGGYDESWPRKKHDRYLETHP